MNNTHFSLVDVPDLQVLPELWPQATDVWMGAGPVPELLHRLLNGLSWLVRLRMLPSLKPFATLFFHAINVMRWGDHRGGMFVEIQGLKADGTNVTRSWHLLAEGDDGPFIPCMALEAAIKRTLGGNAPPAGARAASNDLELDDYEALFTRRTIFTGQREDDLPTCPRSVFRSILGQAFDGLPKPIRDMHDAGGSFQMSGTATVERGKGWLAGLVAAVFQFPAEGKAIPIQVEIDKSGDTEKWKRTFAGRSFSSKITRGKGRTRHLMIERFGPFAFALGLVVDGEVLRYVVRGWTFCGIPLPRAWAPGGDSFESDKEGLFGFDVEIGLPLIGLIVKYSGALSHGVPHVAPDQLCRAVEVAETVS